MPVSPDPLATQSFEASTSPLDEAAQLVTETVPAASDVHAAPATPPPMSSSMATPPTWFDNLPETFAAYGPFLSRQGKVRVQWTPGPDASIVCVAPEEMPLDRVVRLAARLTPALVDATAAGPVDRLSLRDSDGVIVLTLLDGAVLAAAARRLGALALLEVLSARLAPAPCAKRPEVTPAPAVPALTTRGVAAGSRELRALLHGRG